MVPRPRTISIYQRILVPFDGSPAAVGALDEALKLAQGTNVAVRLVHLVDELKYARSLQRASRPDDLAELMEDAGEIILQQGRSRVQACGLRAESVLYTSSSEPLCAVVVEQIVAWRPDLVALHIPLGDSAPVEPLVSHVLEILRASTAPVLTVPYVNVGAGSRNPKEWTNPSPPDATPLPNVRR